MNLQNLINSFNTQIQNNTQIVLNTTTLLTSGASNIDSLLSDMNNNLGLPANQFLTITNLPSNAVSFTGNEIHIDYGNTYFLNANMAISRLTFFDGGDDTLDVLIHTNTFTLNDGSSWLLSSSFPSFIVFPHFNGYLQNEAFIYSSSYSATTSNTYTINNNTLQLNKYLNFYAEFETTLPVIQLGICFLDQFNGGNYSKTPYLFGSIDAHNQKIGPYLNFPDINLTAYLDKGATFKMFDFLNLSNPRLKVCIIDITNHRDPNDTDISPALFFALDLTLGSGEDQIILEFMAKLSWHGSPMLMLIVKCEKNSATLENVFELMNGNQWALPPSLQSLFDEVEFKEFYATIFIDNDNKFTLNSIMVKVGSNPNKKVMLWGPFKKFSFDVVWNILNPLAKDGSKIELMHFDGKLDVSSIGGYLDMELFTG